jgi:hypothetical protein
MVDSLRLILDWDMVLQEYVPNAVCGPSISPEELPLSRPLVDALWTRYKRWSTLFLGSDEGISPLESQTDWRLLEDEGLTLWDKLCRELGPSYKVYFHSEVRKQTFATREEYDQVH